MSYAHRGEGALNYHLCRYGGSKLLFRGPFQRPEGRYAAVFGGAETYGRFVRQPYPALIAAATGLRLFNFGYMNAGLDAFLKDAEIMDIGAGAQMNVVQIIGAQNMSNRFYTVHPRRNDRFLRASSALKQLYEDVDFTEFNFTRHLLRHLQARSPERFVRVAEELKTAWVARMKTLVARLRGRVILLWLADHAPMERDASLELAAEPFLVDAQMIAAVRDDCADYLEQVASPEARAQGTAGMVLDEFDCSVAAELPGPAVHDEIARALAPRLRDLMRDDGDPPEG